MYCSNCGANIEYGEAFCKECGTRVASQSTNYNVFQDFNTFTNNYVNIISDEQLIDAYIGKNAEQIKKGGFSIWSFLFGMFYVIYRKMWLLSTVGIVISLVANLFLPTFATYIVGAFGWAVAFQFNKWYLENAKENVEKIKNENFGVSQQNLIEICRKKGGTSIIAVVIAAICYLAFVIGLTFLAIENTEVEDEWNYNSNVVDSKYTETEDYSTTNTSSSEYFEGYFSSVPKPILDSTWTEDIWGQYKTYSIEDNTYTLKIDYVNFETSKIQPKFAEYEQQLKNNGFIFYEVYKNYYTYIKDDISVVLYVGSDVLNVNLSSGYLAEHYEY